MTQDEQNFDRDFGALLRSLREKPGACPDSDSLAAFARNELEGDAAERMRVHVTGCQDCARLTDLLTSEPASPDDLTWQRARRALDQRTWPWQRSARPAPWAAAAAAVVAVALLSVWMLPREPAQVPQTTRGSTSLTLISPAGVVPELEFRWQTLPVVDGYIIEIARDGTFLKSFPVAGPPYRPDAAFVASLERGVDYRWRIRSVDASGRSLAESAWADFQLER